jgi:hypothetical protein
MIEQIIDSYQDTELLTADGFNKAIIGVSEDFNQPIRLIYSVSKCLNILMVDMEYEEAIEYFNFNVCGAYVGEKTPIWCWDDFE